MKKHILQSVVISLLLLWTGGIAQAAPIVTYSNTYDSVTGLWTYESTIFNDSPDMLYDFVVFPTINPIEGADLSGEGWGIPDIGSDFVHWSSDFGAEIMSGDTMGGFWFTYSGEENDSIGSLAFNVTLWDTAGDQSYLYEGRTVEAIPPSAVPEPDTLFLLGIGIIGIVLARSNICLRSVF